MPDGPLVSYAQNREDVVLWRALSTVEAGRYVEVGAFDPTVHSITRSFYDRGWSGVAVEPLADNAAAYRAARPRDVVVEAAVSAESSEATVFHRIPGTGLSTLRSDVAAVHAAAGWTVDRISVPTVRVDDLIEQHLGDSPVHFMTVDTEGAEREVLSSIDFTRHRPWILVIEATEPLSTAHTEASWEDLVLSADYRFCLFDGLSRFYVAAEHADRLAPALSYPACVHDVFVDAEAAALQARIDDQAARIDDLEDELTRVTDDLAHWRGEVLRAWARAVDDPRPVSQEAARLHAELEAMRQTLSWRVTSPLRAVRSRQLQTRGPA